jgi:hypothetical protein
MAGHAGVPRQAGGEPSGSRLAYRWMPRMLARMLGLRGEDA